VPENHSPGTSLPWGGNPWAAPQGPNFGLEGAPGGSRGGSPRAGPLLLEKSWGGAVYLPAPDLRGTIFPRSGGGSPPRGSGARGAFDPPPPRRNVFSPLAPPPHFPERTQNEFLTWDHRIGPLTGNARNGEQDLDGLPPEPGTHQLECGSGTGCLEVAPIPPVVYTSPRFQLARPATPRPAKKKAGAFAPGGVAPPRGFFCHGQRLGKKRSRPAR